jgi:zinc protease
MAIAIERLGGELEPDLDWQDISLATTIRDDAVGRALAIMGDLIQAPLFPEEGVVRNRSEQLAEREQAKRDPREHADEMFARTVYAAGARYAVAESGDVATIQSLDRATVEGFHKQRFAPERTSVIVVGAVDPEVTMDAVQRSLGSWQALPSESFGTTIDDAARSVAIHVVDRPGSAQTELRVGHVGVPRLHPDYFALVVMNSVLGGLFNSRINLNLRERHGYTYGAFSAFHWRVNAGPFVVSTAVQTDATAAAVREILSEIDRIRQEPISEEERSLAVNYLAGVFPIRYETTAAIASALAAMRIFGLPGDYFDTYRERILSVSADDVLRVAQAHLHPDRLQVVALGDGSVVEPLLATLGRNVVRIESR